MTTATRPLPEDNHALVVFAVGASLLLHVAFLVGGAALAFFEANRPKQVSLSKPEQPPTLEISVIVPDPAPDELDKKVAPRKFIRTHDDQKSPSAPDDALFESNRDTLAGSDTAPSEKGSEDVPSMDGIDLPFPELEERRYRDGDLKERDKRGDGEVDKVAAMSVPLPQFTTPDPVQPRETEPERERRDPQEAPTPDAREERPSEATEKLALRDAEDPTLPAPAQVMPAAMPAPEQPRESPMLPASANPQLPSAAGDPAVTADPDPEKTYQAFTPKTRMEGRISNIGRPSVDARKTLKGEYMSIVQERVGRLWNRYCRDNGDFVRYGTIKVKFSVNRGGKAEGVRVLSSDAGAAMTKYTLDAITRAKLPPLPDGLLHELEGDRLNIEYEFISL